MQYIGLKIASNDVRKHDKSNLTSCFSFFGGSATDANELKKTKEPLTVKVKEPEDTEWSDLNLATGVGKWRGGLATKFGGKPGGDATSATSWFPQVEKYSRLDRSLVELQFTNMTKPVVFNVQTPKMQKLFSFYCDHLMQRKIFTDAVANSRRQASKK